MEAAFFLHNEAALLGHLHAGQPKPRKQLRFRDQVDARISPPADEYYIMQYEGAGLAWQWTSELKDKTIVVASKGALLNGSKFRSGTYLA